MAYISPTLPVYILIAPLMLVHGIYAKYFGLSLVAIATVQLASRLFDAVTDPMVGYWCDRYHAKSGSRKPFVIAGALLLLLSSYFLFVPSVSAVTATYFLVWMLVFYFAFTLFEISHLSWGAQLVVESSSKTGLYGLRSMAANMGLLLFYAVPFMPFFPSRAFTPQTLYWVIILAAILILPSLWFCYLKTPNSYLPTDREKSGARVKNSDQPYSGFWSLRRNIISNKPLLIFLAAFFCFGIGVGMWASMQFIVIDVYLGMGEHLASANVIGLCAGVALIGFWVKLANQIGKKLTWIVGVLLYIVSIFLAGLLKPDSVTLSSLVWVMVLNYVGIVGINIVVPSLLTDIIDYSTWRFGTDKAATYFSLQMFIIKTTAALGSALAFGIAGYYGFDVNATSHSSGQVFALQLTAFWLPIPILLLTMIFIALVPMDSRRHRIVRRRSGRQSFNSSSVKY